MSTDYKNIIFFYPSRVVGGAEFLFARLAKYMKEYLNLSVFYIDYRDGFIRNNPEFSSLNFIDYSDGKKTDINFCADLITPISNIYRIKEFINFNNSEIKLFFWGIHPLNVVHVMPEAKTLENFDAHLTKFIMKNFCRNNYNCFYNLLLECKKLKSTYFMNHSTYIYNEIIFPGAIEKEYLPIASCDKKYFANENIINNDEINVCILGRLCQEKTNALLMVLDNMNLLKTNKKKKVHIIGDGECKNLIKPQKYKDIEIIFAGTLVADELDSYLANNVDILFSMGTSVLEGSALKLPVIPIPYSYKRFYNNKFYFFYKSNNYDLGATVDEYSNIADLSIDEVIDIIYYQNQKRIIGEKCFDFFNNNFSLKFVSNLIIKLLDKNQLTLSEYNNILQRIGKIKKNKNIVYKILKLGCLINEKK